MLIAKAYAQAVEIGENVAVAPVASAGQTFMMNMAMVLILVMLFYFLMIRPQQKRFKEHNMMLDSLKKGDKVVTGGGLIGTIDKIVDGKNEITVDLGGGVKVTAMRATINKFQENKGSAWSKTGTANSNAVPLKDKDGDDSSKKSKKAK